MLESPEGPTKVVVIHADAISQTDTDGADIVTLLAGELQARGITLALARIQPSILDLWTRAGAIEALGPKRVFGAVREAVDALRPTPAAIDRSATSSGPG